MTDLRTIRIGWAPDKPGFLRHYVWCPLEGRCPFCKSLRVSANSTGRTKTVFTLGLPYGLQNMGMRCASCKKNWVTTDERYVSELDPTTQCRQTFITRGPANVADECLVKLLRESSVSSVSRIAEAAVWEDYLRNKAVYESIRRNRRALRLEKSDEVEPFPPFDTSFIPSRRFLVAVLLWDYHKNKPYLRRELRQVTSQYALSCDCQRGVIKKTRGKDIVGCAGQTATVAGDHNLCLNVVAVPSTNEAWLDQLFGEISRRHQGAPPKRLYLDFACCGGREGVRTVPREKWKRSFRIVLDGTHLLMRIGRQVSGENPRRGPFLRDLSRAVYQAHPLDVKMLMDAKKSVGDEEPISRRERCRFIRRVIGDGKETADRVKRVVDSYRRADEAAKHNLKNSSQEDKRSPADATSPIVTEQVLKTVRSQITHLRNGCCEDDLNNPPYRAVGSVQFKGGEKRLIEYRSLRGTSKNECIHSVMTKAFASWNGLTAVVYDCRLSWIISRYNRRRMLFLEKKVPPVALTARDVEMFIAAGALKAEDFPDYSLAHKDSEVPLVGFEYGQQCNSDIAASDIAASDPSTEDNFAEDALKEEDLDAVVDFEAKWDNEAEGYEVNRPDRILEIPSPVDDEVSVLGEPQDMTNDAVESQGVPSDESLFGGILHARTPRNVAKKKALTSSPGSVSPGFNHEMEEVWLSILNELAGTHRGDSLTRKCLAKYNDIKHKHITDSRSNGGQTPALLGVNYGLADIWIKKQLQIHSVPAKESMFDAETRGTMKDLHSSLSAVSAACRAALDRPAPSPEIHILPTNFDTGPAPIRAEDVRKEVLQARAGPIIPDNKKEGSDSTTGICPYCGLSLEPGKNAHQYNGRSYKNGLCPMKPATDESTESRKMRVHSQPGMEERRRRAQETLQSVGNPVFSNDSGKRQRSCSVCDQLWASCYNGLRHQYIGRGAGATFCPFGDPIEVLENYLKSKSDKKKEYWRQQNAKRRAAAEQEAAGHDRE
ncbi:hypothetical protein FOZ63_020997 [Perkinsus olseni]|uniref:Uncharacterized protein n=1 Tax=Perkinsus olseni TaxID=32597 RepID=A0A7J6T3Z0_PEROL|nr:hypothetical protein FOZ63_020997 [Perkinsus olseni]KAF4739442.1 hypothetical protein FOZ62_027117 [Perkinsus olseni]